MKNRSLLLIVFCLSFIMANSHLKAQTPSGPTTDGSATTAWNVKEFEIRSGRKIFDTFLVFQCLSTKI